MAFLRRALQLFAAVWGACGLAIAVTPRWILVSWFDQVPYPDYTYVRVSGAMAIGLSLLAVLVGRKIEDVWWWAWSFAITDAAVATIVAVNALVGGPEGSAVTFWWLFCALNAALAAGLLLGLGRAGQEKPFA